MTDSFTERLVDAKITIEDQKFDDITVKEIILGESLLTPGLQTAVTLQSFVYTKSQKDWMQYKNKKLTIDMSNEMGQSMYVRQQLYRIDNRELDINVGQNETLTLHACDESLLNDAKSLVSKSWKCTQPSDVVDYVLRSCAGASQLQIDDCDPARDYIAENIHPFQVVQQQANVALDDEDPSFLHYMTFEDTGKHYFRSLKKLMHEPTIREYYHSETKMDLDSGGSVINFSFPCVFDYLSDLLNGLDENGQNINTLSTFNPLNMGMQLFGLGGGGGGSGGDECGLGAANHKQAMTNKGTSEQQNSCDTDVEKYLLKRQARMALLEKDKIALRLTIPWDPHLHVGNNIKFTWTNKTTGSEVSGSGDYLISSLKHNIQFGGYATTTLDCITRNL